MKNKQTDQPWPFSVSQTQTTPPMLSLAGYSGTGKTTFLEKLIPEFTRRGLRVGSIKHDVHGFEMDKPGKDSWRHKKAGAATTIISSPVQIGMVMDVGHDHTPHDLLPFFAGLDIVLIEGFKRADNPKMEIFRPEVTAEPLCKDDPNLIAMVSDAVMDIGVPIFSPGDPAAAAHFVIAHFNLQTAVT